MCGAISETEKFCPLPKPRFTERCFLKLRSATQTANTAQLGDVLAWGNQHSSRRAENFVWKTVKLYSSEHTAISNLSTGFRAVLVSAGGLTHAQWEVRVLPMRIKAAMESQATTQGGEKHYQKQLWLRACLIFKFKTLLLLPNYLATPIFSDMSTHGGNGHSLKMSLRGTETQLQNIPCISALTLGALQSGKTSIHVFTEEKNPRTKLEMKTF